MRATWSEIDGNRWNVPADHMKSGVARTIPLSTAAETLLDSEGVDCSWVDAGADPIGDARLFVRRSME